MYEFKDIKFDTKHFLSSLIALAGRISVCEQRKEEVEQGRNLDFTVTPTENRLNLCFWESSNVLIISLCRSFNAVLAKTALTNTFFLPDLPKFWLLDLYLAVSNVYWYLCCGVVSYLLYWLISTYRSISWCYGGLLELVHILDCYKIWRKLTYMKVKSRFSS